jgi:sulfate permease, SulP family
MAISTQAASRSRTSLRLFPGLRGYQIRSLPADFVAGMTLAAYAVPVSLGYATLAGLPPHFGIYCYLVGGAAYAFLGTSRQLAIGPTSAIAMLVGITVAGMAPSDPARWAGIASLTALIVGVLCFLAWMLRLNGLMSFVGDTIMIGFKAGAALTIALTQLPKLFGVPGGGEHFLERLYILAKQLPDTNPSVLGFGLAALAALLAGEKLLPGRPVALAVVILSIVLMSTPVFDDHGIKLVGELPAGLPEFRLPSLRLHDVDGVLALAFACFLLSYIESVSAARALAVKNGYEIDARQELLALGAGNFAVAFAQGFPVAGGLSQSAVNDSAGAKSPLALIFASTILGVCLLFLTGLLQNLPTVVLAAVVLVAVKGLIDIPAMHRLWHISRFEFHISVVALVGVLLFGILKGVLLAAIVSLLMLIAATAQPTVAFLGRIPGTRRYSDLERHPDNEAIPGVLIFRIEASLIYFNVDHVHQLVWNKIQASENLQVVICDLSNSPHVDVAGARWLIELQKGLTARNITLRIAEAHARVRDTLRAADLPELVGYIGRNLTVDQVIVEFERTSSTNNPGGYSIR